jgi:hypothetical protein
MMTGTISVGGSRRQSGCAMCSYQPTYSRTYGRNDRAGTPGVISQHPSADSCRVVCVTNSPTHQSTRPPSWNRRPWTTLPGVK